MSKLHIRKDDTVVVLAGADKGKTGKVLKVLVDENRAIVEGVNMVSRSLRLRPLMVVLSKRRLQFISLISASLILRVVGLLVCQSSMRVRT